MRLEQPLDDARRGDRAHADMEILLRRAEVGDDAAEIEFMLGRAVSASERRSRRRSYLRRPSAGRSSGEKPAATERSQHRLDDDGRTQPASAASIALPLLSQHGDCRATVLGMSGGDEFPSFQPSRLPADYPEGRSWRIDRSTVCQSR